MALFCGAECYLANKEMVRQTCDQDLYTMVTMWSKKDKTLNLNIRGNLLMPPIEQY